MLQNLKDWFKKPYEGEGKRQVESYIKNRVRALKGMFILVVLLTFVLTLDDQFNISGFLGIPCKSIYSEERCIGKDKFGYSFVDGSGYISNNASATSNVFLLKEVTSQFSVGNIVTIGDSKKEHEIVEVKPLNKSESGNYQTIILMEGVGFDTSAGMKVSVVR